MRYSQRLIYNKNYSEETIFKIMRNNGVPPKFMDADLNDFPLFEYSKEASLYIYGKTGVGKTRLLCAIGKELSSVKGFNPGWRLISVPELLFKIRQCYNSDQSESKLVNLYSTIDVLLLDDLGAEKSSEWSLQTLYLILNKRYEFMAQTIISSNYKISQLVSVLGERLTSRISEICQVLKLSGSDRRV